MANAITLYTARTGNGHRASIMLEEAGFAYDVRAIDLAAGEHRGEALRAVNPMGQIPALIDRDGPDGLELRLSESAAIVRYLAHKSGRLLPQGAREEAEADRWAAIAAGGLSPVCTALFLARQAGIAGDSAFLTDLRERIGRYLAVMEARLGESAFLVGDEYSYADILAFTLANGTLGVLGFGLDRYPAVAAWKDGIAARPAVRRGLKVPA